MMNLLITIGVFIVPVGFLSAVYVGCRVWGDKLKERLGKNATPQQVEAALMLFGVQRSFALMVSLIAGAILLYGTIFVSADRYPETVLIPIYSIAGFLLSVEFIRQCGVFIFCSWSILVRATSSAWHAGKQR